jgi:hypothetical protein
VTDKRNYAETRLHIDIAGWLDKWLTDDVWFTTFPAGGGGYDRGKILRQMKLRPGVPDIFPILYRWFVFGMEIKAGKNDPTDTQLECHAILQQRGVYIDVVRSLDDAKAAVAKWGLPIRTASKTTERLTQAIRQWQSSTGQVTYNRECVICGHKFWGGNDDDCPRNQFH